MTSSGSAPRDPLSALLGGLLATPGGPPPPDPARILRPGARVGRFELLRELGRGGFGVVFEALDTELGRRVAFKALRPAVGAGDAERDLLLRDEAAAGARLQHPAIVTLHDFGHGDAGPYLILELLRGEPLAARLARGRVSSREAVRVALAVAGALGHAHAHGVLHRDLTPSNVFLTLDGDVKVLDFGLARALDRGAGRGGGTPGHMAPEQARGADEDARTDLFALGVLLFDLLVPPRRRPAPGPAGEAAVAPEAVPAPFRALVERLTSADPAGRPGAAAEVEAALRRIGAHLDETRRRPGAPPSEAARVAALRELFLAEQCAARPVFGQDCREAFRRATDLDPTLAAAHYQFAVWSRRFGGTAGEQRAAIARALRHRARASPAERLLIHAFAAQARGRGAAAAALLREAAERFPDDPRAPYELADHLRQEDALGPAVPWLERTLALDPGHGWAAGQLAEALGALGRGPALAAWVARWEAAPSPTSLHGASLGHGWLGDLAAAEAAARRAMALGAGLPAQLDLLGALIVGKRHGEAEAAFGRLAEPGSPVRRLGHYLRAALHAYRGHRRAGWAELERLVAEVPGAAADALVRSVRVDYLLGDRNLDAVRAEVFLLAGLDPVVAAAHAPALAWLGDEGGAAVLAAALPPGSTPARAAGALLRWRRGEVDGALADLGALAREAPMSLAVWRTSAWWLLGDVAVQAGRWAEAEAALSRLLGQFTPRMMWRSWAKGWAQAHLARCRLAQGDPAGARAHLSALGRERGEPDPGDALAAEAAALTAAAGPAPGA